MLYPQCHDLHIIIIIIIINAKIKVTLNEMLQGHYTKIIKRNNTLSVSEGGLEESCFQITAKRLQ